MLAGISEIETRRRVSFELGTRASAAVGPVDPAIVAGLEAAAARQGIATMPLGSPASHDAAAFAAAGVPIAMLFVRNPTGVSHSPAEFADPADCEAGIDALVGVVTELCGGTS